MIGVDYGGGPTAPPTLAHGASISKPYPVTFPFGPDRLLDTRSIAGRSNSFARPRVPSMTAFRLRGRSWLDVAVGDG